MTASIFMNRMRGLMSDPTRYYDSIGRSPLCKAGQDIIVKSTGLVVYKAVTDTWDKYAVQLIYRR